MRNGRLKEEGEGFYHVISRVVDRRMGFDNREKERLRKLMRAVEGFSGVNVLTYALLTNHFHILLHVPERQQIDDDEFTRRLGLLYDKERVKTVRQHLELLREGGHHKAAETFKEKYTYRMYDLSEFVKTFKQRFTQSYNCRHERKGTLWEERFKSVLVEGKGHALSAVASYIDRNAVLAGIVKDPKDYRFCGYGEAMGGSRRARAGIGLVLQSGGQWRQTAAEYRELLYASREAVDEADGGEPGFSSEEVQRVLDRGGELSRDQLLCCRVRYFTDGAVLGSRVYVEDVFCRHRHQFGARRQSGARPMLGGAVWGDLFTARRLRLCPITVPAVA